MGHQVGGDIDQVVFSVSKARVWKVQSLFTYSHVFSNLCVDIPLKK